METKQTKKRKQPSGLRGFTIAIDSMIIALPTPEKTSDGNSRCLRSQTSGNKSGKQVTRVSGAPIKLSNKGDDIDVNLETPRRRRKAKFRPKVMKNSPTTTTTPEPTTPSLPSRGRRGRPSSRRRLDFGSAGGYIQTKTMQIYTKGGFCFTRKVTQYIEYDHQKSLECKKEEEEWCKNERELFQQRALSFIMTTRLVQGNRPFMGWKGSVVDSVVGVFLTQNTADNYSSSAFMSLAAKYPNQNISYKDNHTQDTLDWNAVRRAPPGAISHAIQERGMNNRIAARIKTFLKSIRDKNSGILDLEWLRNAKPEIATEFLSKVHGLGIKSTDCVRLLTLRQRAFPVDRHVARIAVRLGWVPVEKLPDDVLIHQLQEYPMMDSVQEYLSQKIGNLDADTLYELHYQMITFGKVFCTKNKPNCNSCPLKKDCRHFASAFARTEPSGEKTFVPVTHVLSAPASCGLDNKFSLDQDIEDIFLSSEVHPVISKTGKLRKNIGRSRTEHQVYELPDSHPLVEVLEKRDSDDKNPYLLAIWPQGETENPSGMMRNEECHSLISTQPGNADSQQEEETMFGTYLVPCRTATRGSFPLDGTFFQINEVFADDESSTKPLVFPRKLLCDLTKKTLFCGTSISTIFEGFSAQEIQDCFLKGYVCVRGFSMKTREARPLPEKFHRKGIPPTRRTTGGRRTKSVAIISV